MFKRISALGTVVMTFALACGGEKDDAPATPSEPFQLRALTYNTALAQNFEPLATERAPLVVDALADLAPELDLLCVQELWQESDADALQQAVASELPHALRADPLPGSGTCSEEELGTIGGCLQDSCGAAQGVELTACAQQACAGEIGGLSGGCLACILDSLGAPLETCLGDGSERNDPAIFGGAYDVALFSRFPLERTRVIPLDAYFVRAVRLHAKVTVPGLGAVHAICTHLGSPLGVIPYAGSHGSWEGEHASQVELLAEAVRAYASDGLPVIVLGDLNMGPAVGSSVAMLEDQYRQLLDAGLSNPYAEGSNALCTDCADNTFHAASPDYPDGLIDHVLVGRFPAHHTAVSRVLDTPVSFGDFTYDLSDHYGVRLDITHD